MYFFQAARVLIEAGADLDALNQAGVCGSPLHLSVSKANAEITREIIKKGEHDKDRSMIKFDIMTIFC